jgi:hypothetical protein
MRQRGSALAVVMLLVVAAACSGESNDASTSKTPKPTAVHKSKGPGCQYLVAAEGKRQTPSSDGLEYLKDAVATHTPCYDKISFVFDQGSSTTDLAPGYTVEYRKPPFAPNFHSTTEGFKPATAILYVEFRFASDFDGRRAGSGVQTYKGNQRLRLGRGIHHTVIVEWLKDLKDPTPENPLDNKIVWLIGLDGKRRFTVDGASTPPHVNILIMR